MSAALHALRDRIEWLAKHRIDALAEHFRAKRVKSCLIWKGDDCFHASVEDVKANQEIESSSLKSILLTQMCDYDEEKEIVLAALDEKGMVFSVRVEMKRASPSVKNAFH